MTEASPILQLKNVTRVFPRDATNIPGSALRELVLPHALYARPRATEFYALRDVSLTVLKGQTVGVIGSYRSGKSTLAALAGGTLAPTTGTVEREGQAQLYTKANASYRPMLSVVENMRFRGRLAGLSAEAVEPIIASCLEQTGITRQRAETPFINLPPHMARRVGLLFALRLPGDLLVVDGHLAGGALGMEAQALLRDRLTGAAGLLVSNDEDFLNSVAAHTLLLHAGRIYGPFPTDVAFEHFAHLPSYEEDHNYAAPAGEAEPAYDPLQPPLQETRRKADPEGETLEDEDDDDDSFEDEDDERRDHKEKYLPVALVEKIHVEQKLYSHSQHVLLRAPGETMNVRMSLLFDKSLNCHGGVVGLHGGESGIQVGAAELAWPAKTINKGERVAFEFTFTVPNEGEKYYGLSFTPLAEDGQSHIYNRLKILIFGMLSPPRQSKAPLLAVDKVRFDRVGSGNM